MAAFGLLESIRYYEYEDKTMRDENLRKFYTWIGIDPTDFIASYSRQLFSLTSTQAREIWDRDDNWVPIAQALVHWALEEIPGWIMIHTTDGHIGWGSAGVLAGDVVAVLKGCEVPLILRKVNSDSHYELVGRSFVVGFMNGEAAQRITDVRKFHLH
ncbi:hypothetical protein O1611_g7450 [Lasiodiplodia mahajangana]|uniref:Uncharacterized protein n=1 Tax=Lasiodiplodia mahajangana TaxID=1108764 RepID=A0ACC2JF78_9PEZI|nr:hypothetical protein O1611_g7450 [Lasiodiplodia mahajangana]